MANLTKPGPAATGNFTVCHLEICHAVDDVSTDLREVLAAWNEKRRIDRLAADCVACPRGFYLPFQAVNNVVFKYYIDDEKCIGIGALCVPCNRLPDDFLITQITARLGGRALPRTHYFDDGGRA